MVTYTSFVVRIIFHEDNKYSKFCDNLLFIKYITDTVFKFVLQNTTFLCN